MSTLRQLAYFVAVAEEGSFTRAAARMHVAQPSLSQQVRALERELGGELIERLPRRIRLTAAGRAMLPHATAAVRSAARARSAARSALALETGEIEIGTVRSIAVGLLPDLVQRWRARHPGTVVRLNEFGHRHLTEESVRAGESDIGIGPPPLDWHGPVEHLGWEELVIVLPSDDPLADARALPLRALAHREWVMFERGHGLHDLLLAGWTATATPLHPRQAVVTSQVETAARLAAAGVGPAFVPRNTLPADLRGAVLSVDPPLGRELTVFTRGDWSPLARAFVALMREADWDEPPSDAVLLP